MSQSEDKPCPESEDSEEQASGDVFKEETKEGKKKVVPPPVKPKLRPPTAHGSRTPLKLNGDDQNKEKETDIGKRLTRRSFSTPPIGSADMPSTSSAQYTAGGPSRRSGMTRTFVDQVTEEEQKVGEQGKFLMNMFIQQRAENTRQEPIIREVCHADKSQAKNAGLSDETLSDIAVTLRKIGDDISRNVELNTFIEQVPIHSTKEIFVKVCLQIFQQGELNWGRVVALFYFAYRLIMRTLERGRESMPWVEDMLQWAGDFLVRHVAKWILGRGGWQMIKEWFGPSNRTWMMLFFASLTFGLWAYFRKD